MDEAADEIDRLNDTIEDLKADHERTRRTERPDSVNDTPRDRFVDLLQDQVRELQGRIAWQVDENDRLEMENKRLRELIVSTLLTGSAVDRTACLRRSGFAQAGNHSAIVIQT